MSYDIELRKRVIDFIDAGGQKTDAAILFQLSRSTIYEWLKRPNLQPVPRGNCDRKLKKEELAAHVEAFPDALQRERAVHFEVHRSTIGAALKKMGIRKKNEPLHREES
jgi:transposase